MFGGKLLRGQRLFRKNAINIFVALDDVQHQRKTLGFILWNCKPGYLPSRFKVSHFNLVKANKQSQNCRPRRDQRQVWWQNIVYLVWCSTEVNKGQTVLKWLVMLPYSKNITGLIPGLWWHSCSEFVFVKNESEQTAFRCPVWSAGGAMCAFSNHQSLCTGTDSYMVHHHESYVGLTRTWWRWGQFSSLTFTVSLWWI